VPCSLRWIVTQLVLLELGIGVILEKGLWRFQTFLIFKDLRQTKRDSKNSFAWFVGDTLLSFFETTQLGHFKCFWRIHWGISKKTRHFIHIFLWIKCVILIYTGLRFCSRQLWNVRIFCLFANCRRILRIVDETQWMRELLTKYHEMREFSAKCTAF
jgi:hypothetical protein